MRYIFVPRSLTLKGRRERRGFGEEVAWLNKGLPKMQLLLLLRGTAAEEEEQVVEARAPRMSLSVTVCFYL